jgi:2'-5' RNA ligase
VELNPKVSGFGAKHGSPKKITDFGPLRRDGGPNGGKPFPPKGNFGKGGFRGAATPKPSPRKSPAEFRFTKYPPTLAGQSRLFLAIPLPDHVIAEIAKLREHSPLMAKKLREFKLHVTLKYLGYVPSETLPLIVKKLSEVKFAPFEIALPGMHVYKFNRKKKELILKVEDTDPLRLLKRSVSLALKPLRLPPIRVIHQVPVIPHVSLIYPPRVPSPDLDNLLARHNRHFGSFKAEKFVLYLTTTTEANLEHTALHSFSAS